MAKHTAESIRETAKYGLGTGAFQRLVLEILADLVEDKERVEALRRIAGQGKKLKDDPPTPKLADKNESAV